MFSASVVTTVTSCATCCTTCASCCDPRATWCTSCAIVSREVSRKDSRSLLSSSRFMVSASMRSSIVTLHVQVLHIQGVFLNKFPPAFHVLAHQRGENL